MWLRSLQCMIAACKRLRTAPLHVYVCRRNSDTTHTLKGLYSKIAVRYIPTQASLGGAPSGHLEPTCRLWGISSMRIKPSSSDTSKAPAVCWPRGRNQGQAKHPPSPAVCTSSTVIPIGCARAPKTCAIGITKTHSSSSHFAMTFLSSSLT